VTDPKGQQAWLQFAEARPQQASIHFGNLAWSFGESTGGTTTTWGR
jgi:hypothetical protein